MTRSLVPPAETGSN